MSIKGISLVHTDTMVFYEYLYKEVKVLGKKSKKTWNVNNDPDRQTYDR